MLIAGPLQSLRPDAIDEHPSLHFALVQWRVGILPMMLTIAT
jgi:hypothetical protein